MPFGQPYDEYYQEIYLPAIQKHSLKAQRADYLYRPSPILHDIWDFINEAPLIIADITRRNPNVMYELGLAHAIAKPAIIISDNIQDVPFDLRSLRILLYDIKKPSWAQALQNAIERAIHEILESPAEAVLPTFLKVRPSKQEDVSEIKKDLIEIKQVLYRFEQQSGSPEEYYTKVLDAKEYSNAVIDAHKLYYDEGLDLSQIRDFLISKYRISMHAAADVVNIARQR